MNMRKGIIAMLVVSFMSLAAVNTASAQDYQRDRDYNYNHHRRGTTTTITTTRTHREQQPGYGYHREGTWYGYKRTTHRTYRRGNRYNHNYNDYNRNKDDFERNDQRRDYRNDLDKRDYQP
jgi:hypothetical protein